MIPSYLLVLVSIDLKKCLAKLKHSDSNTRSDITVPFQYK